MSECIGYHAFGDVYIFAVADGDVQSLSAKKAARVAVMVKACRIYSLSLSLYIYIYPLLVQLILLNFYFLSFFLVDIYLYRRLSTTLLHGFYLTIPRPTLPWKR
mgnify:CR=1 FL=1